MRIYHAQVNHLNGSLGLNMPRMVFSREGSAFGKRR